MSEPTNPPAFDPRRLADLASRLAAKPAPAAAQPAGTQPAAAQPAGTQPGEHESTASRPYVPEPTVSHAADGAGAASRPAGAGEDAGHLQIDAVLAELKRAEQLPPDQQIAVYEAVHRTLQETLRSIEQS